MVKGTLYIEMTKDGGEKLKFESQIEDYNSLQMLNSRTVIHQDIGQ